MQTGGGQLSDCILITAGKPFSVPNRTYAGSIPTIHLGYLSEAEMVKAFNAATLFVCPTLEDSGPGILGQAMLCSVPTVAFATGAAVDMIRTGHTGYLAELGDSDDLANGIEYVVRLNPNEYAEMSDRCRQTGLSVCSFEAVGARLEELINNENI